MKKHDVHAIESAEDRAAALEEGRELILYEYAAGTIDYIRSLAVACYARMRPQANEYIRFWENLGGSVLQNLQPAETESLTLADMKARLEQTETGASIHDETHPSGNFDPTGIQDYGHNMPPALVKCLEGNLRDLPWKKRPGGIRYLEIAADKQSSRKAALYSFPPGMRIPAHSHASEEITLVLKGAFEDNYGRHEESDLVVIQADEDLSEPMTHSPHADAREGCLCLIVTARPPLLKGIPGWLLNPFLQLLPA